MKNVRLIRHGERAANAGEPTRDHASIPLTAKGLEQARAVAQSITCTPGLILASPFLRAQTTAQATAAIYPDAAFETWPVHEFTYLAPARCGDTTLAERRGWVEAYWERADPAFSDGEGAESFIDLVTRVQAFLKRLAEQPSTDIVVFSHGQVMNTVRWLLEKRPQEIDSGAMLDWRQYEIANHVPNCQGFSIFKESAGNGWLISRGEFMDKRP
ncbi:histidine phosphatase family protein [Pseudomonas aeruginosa]|uniref:histidine phosphatase family protein n=1 Tax=Pseudomonas TaxID=286 RepID=UPI0007615A5C|nr:MULTISPECIES: histidine phosphatase family protein [Pseudomonas]EKT4505267.1 histidine phosphatase family protein [Pseudomonas putida]MDD2039296.1 histidine phosphatase family protein [Pseudomonas putida]MDD2044931.1 histidine phosphatase family protein [Pseudomonas putida]